VPNTASINRWLCGRNVVPLLFGIQDENTIPIEGRGILQENPNTLGIEIQKMPDAEAIFDLAAAGN
jgi:hypothetical protein